MFTSEQYRAKALEFDNLARIAVNANDKREYQKLQQRFAELADNEEWLADHYNQMLHAADTEYSALAKEEPVLQSGPSDNVRLAQEAERILRCLGAALIMQWGTLPRKLQRELFDNAGAMGDSWTPQRFAGKSRAFCAKTTATAPLMTGAWPSPDRNCSARPRRGGLAWRRRRVGLRSLLHIHEGAT